MMLGFTGLLCFIAVYLGYVSLLGGYDGLPPLPVSSICRSLSKPSLIP